MLTSDDDWDGMCGGLMWERGEEEKQCEFGFFWEFRSDFSRILLQCNFFLVGGSGEDDDVGVGLMGFDGGY